MGAVFIPSEFGLIFVPLANVQVRAGDKLRITCRYSHLGQAESVPLYAAIGNTGWAGFDEVLHGSKTISVPEDSAWNYREDYVDITITTAISQGVYDLYAKKLRQKGWAGQYSPQEKSWLRGKRAAVAPLNGRKRGSAKLSGKPKIQSNSRTLSKGVYN